MLTSGQISISKALTHFRCSAGGWGLSEEHFSSFQGWPRLVNMNNGVRSVYRGISNSCRLLSIVMRYNINSRRVIRNNIAHSGCQMSYFCCIMDYLSGISWPFLVPTYPRVLPIFTVLPLVNTPQSSPVIGPIIRGRHDIIRIDITNIPIPNYKGVFPHLHARHSWIISTKLQSGSMWLIPKIAEGSILDFIFRDTEYWVLTVRIISPGSHLRQVEGWEHESSPA